MPLTARVTNTVHGMVAEKRSGTRHVHRHDPLGSVIGLVNDSATTTDTYTYWPYGTLQASTGSTQQPWKFVGKYGYYTDSATHNYVRARKYRKDLGRWLTVDPLWPGQLAYEYGAANPTTMIDPNGLQATVWCIPCIPPPPNPTPAELDTWCDWAARSDEEPPVPGKVAGRTYCCNGRKITCVFGIPKGAPGIGRCISLHERVHQLIEHCECTTGLCTLEVRNTAEYYAHECIAWTAELGCYGQGIQNCKTKQCRDEFRQRICEACDKLINCINANIEINPVYRSICKGLCNPSWN